MFYRLKPVKKKNHFLDLNIEIEDGGFKVSTFFKSTDGYGYIGQGSCHHHTWLKSIPKSQFVRLRQNCTLKRDYLGQASILKRKFLEKGYKTTDLDEVIKEVASLDRATIMKSKEKTQNAENAHNFSMITTYSQQL